MSDVRIALVAGATQGFGRCLNLATVLTARSFPKGLRMRPSREIYRC